MKIHNQQSLEIAERLKKYSQRIQNPERYEMCSFNRIMEEGE